MSVLFGARVRRVEDADLVSGRGRYVDDIDVDGVLHLALRRSVVAHADLAGVDLADAAGRPGVSLFTGEDVAGWTWDHVLPGVLPLRTPLATGRVRYQGEPVAAALSEDLHAAVDAAGEIWVDYAERPAVVDVESAMAEGAPLVYEEAGSNVVYRSGSGRVDGLFEGADVVVEETYVNQRMAPGMLEARAILAVPDADSRITVHCSHQSPHGLQRQVASALAIEREMVRVVVPDVGGGFGSKASFYPEYPLVAGLAMRMGRPVKYVETRSENLLVAAHGRGQRTTVAIGARRTGEIVGIRFATVGDLGAAIDNQRWCLHLTEQMVSGCYRIPRVEREVLGVLTNTAPVGAFRGAGRPEAAYAIERAIDQLARGLDIDPLELRRMNFLSPDEFPHSTAAGATYDSGNYRQALDLAAERIGYDELRAEQANRTGGSLLGVGFASYVELSGGGQEYGEVEIADDGSVTVKTGTSPHGQGHRTTWAQIAADRLGVPLEAVTVLHGDTDVIPRGGGTSGSRSAPLGGTAVSMASESLATQLCDLAAQRLEAAAEDIRLKSGRAVVVGTDVAIELGDLAAGAGGTVSAEWDFVTPGLTYPFGAHGCAVEIDPDTGEIRVRAFAAVDDCGRVINPIITEGQVHGGIAQGVAHALAEEIRYDEAGNLVTSNWATYPIPAISDVLPIDSSRTETPTPNNPLGLKGVGEAGATGSTPAVANAVFDALARFGVTEAELPMPYTPAKLWKVLRGKLE